MILGGVLNELTGKKKSQTIKGTVVLMKKNVLDFNAIGSSAVDNVLELVGQQVTLQLVSAQNADPGAFLFQLFVLISLSSFAFC